MDFAKYDRAYSWIGVGRSQGAHCLRWKLLFARADDVAAKGNTWRGGAKTQSV